MSGLEKFEGTEAWFAKLKSLLLKDRPTPQKQKEDIDKSHDINIALDYSKDFKDILEENKFKKMDKENIYPEGTAPPDFYFDRSKDGTLMSMLSQNTTRLSNNSKCTFISHNDSTFCEEPSILRQTTDESFELMEKMCNKSMSDPDSTLYRYLNSFQDSKKSEDEEAGALNRLLDEFDLQEDCKNDQTQIANVEPPSCMWEDTLAGDIPTFRTSPVKMVGLMRPSTILEESSSSEFTHSSSFSYKTAQKTNDTSSEQYDTANETNKPDRTESNPDESYNANQTQEDEKEDDDDFNKTLSYEDDSSRIEFSDHQFKAPVIRTINSSHNLTKLNVTGDIYNNSKKSLSLCSQNPNIRTECSKAAAKINTDVFPHIKHTFYGEDFSKGLLSPDRSSLSAIRSNSSSYSNFQSKNTLSDVSSLMEDSLIVVDPLKHRETESEFQDSLDVSSDSSTKPVDLINLDDDSLHTPRRSAVIKPKPTIIELSDDDELNQGFSFQKENEENSTLNISREFNDTIEEMEYIMQQGMKYMTEKGATPQMVKSVVLSSTVKAEKSPSTPNEGVVKQTRKALTSEKPKTVDTFKKPLSCSRIPYSRPLLGLKKATNFCHVVSPVGAYIKNTPKVPLTINAKPAHDVYKSKAIRELEYESRLHTPENESRNIKISNSLPKKGYISAEYKRIVDQRAPAVIPGGEKIHRYLQPAASVIKHEGKLKLNMFSEEKKDLPVNQSVDNSLADLSVMSGDVSLLTIKDAKKIGQ